MSYVKIILALLQIIEAILDWSKEQRLRQEGANDEIARQAVRILQKVNYSNASLETFSRMSESNVLDYLRSLEPKDDGQLLRSVQADNTKQG